MDDAGSLLLGVGFRARAAYLEPGMTADERVERADQARHHARQNPDTHCFVASEVST